MNQTVLITGASSGIGLEFARIFSKQGYKLVLVARSTDKLKQLNQELGGNTMLVSMDLSKQEAPENLYAEMKKQQIQVDVLINNAGFGDYGFFHETSWDKEAMMIDLNMRSLTHLTKLFGSDMVKRKQGKILNVASTAAFFPGPLMSVYYATKHYVLAFSEGLANEWQDFGVTVTALCPGPTESGFQSAAALTESKLVKGKKLPTSQDVAQYGYDALMKGQVVAIHGLMNKLQVLSGRFTPRSLTRWMVRKIQDKH